jgi:hypothetical protein
MAVGGDRHPDEHGDVVGGDAGVQAPDIAAPRGHRLDEIGDEPLGAPERGVVAANRRNVSVSESARSQLSVNIDRNASRGSAISAAEPAVSCTSAMPASAN